MESFYVTVRLSNEIVWSNAVTYFIMLDSACFYPVYSLLYVFLHTVRMLQGLGRVYFQGDG